MHDALSPLDRWAAGKGFGGLDPLFTDNWHVCPSRFFGDRIQVAADVGNILYENEE